MVNHVVPRAELHDFTLALAARIAKRPAFALKLAKESVNQALEAQGQYTAMRAAFMVQQLAHANNRAKYGSPTEPPPAR
jgi:enoyl-CoA hydratase